MPGAVLLSLKIQKAKAVWKKERKRRKKREETIPREKREGGLNLKAYQSLLLVCLLLDEEGREREGHVRKGRKDSCLFSTSCGSSNLYDWGTKKKKSLGGRKNRVQLDYTSSRNAERGGEGGKERVREKKERRVLRDNRLFPGDVREEKKKRGGKGSKDRETNNKPTSEAEKRREKKKKEKEDFLEKGGGGGEERNRTGTACREANNYSLVRPKKKRKRGKKISMSEKREEKKKENKSRWDNPPNVSSQKRKEKRREKRRPKGKKGKEGDIYTGREFIKSLSATPLASSFKKEKKRGGKKGGGKGKKSVLEKRGRERRLVWGTHCSKIGAELMRRGSLREGGKGGEKD